MSGCFPPLNIRDSYFLFETYCLQVKKSGGQNEEENHMCAQKPSCPVGERAEFTGINCSRLGEFPAWINNLPHLRKLKS